MPRKPKKRIHEHKYIPDILLAVCKCSEKRAYKVEKKLKEVIKLVEKST